MSLEHTNYYANLGHQIDQAATRMIDRLVNSEGYTDNDPHGQISIARSQDNPYEVITRVHQTRLRGIVKHVFVARKNFPGHTLLGCLEFCRVDAEGAQIGDPIYHVWFDENGSYGVRGQPGYIEEAEGAGERAALTFRNEVTSRLHFLVQEYMQAMAITRQ